MKVDTIFVAERKREVIHVCVFLIYCTFVQSQNQPATALNSYPNDYVMCKTLGSSQQICTLYTFSVCPIHIMELLETKSTSFDFQARLENDVR